MRILCVHLFQAWFQALSDCMALLLQAPQSGLTMSPEISFSLCPPQEPQGRAAGWPAMDHPLVSNM